MERLNWLADTSDNGLRQSAGMMINYRYKLTHIEANHEAYTGDGKISTSSQVRATEEHRINLGGLYIKCNKLPLTVHKQPLVSLGPTIINQASAGRHTCS